MKTIITLILLFFISINSLPQEKKYFDSPFGGGGGFTPGWLFPNIDPLNEKLSNIGPGDGIPALAENGLFTSGGAGFIYIGFVPGLRVGGMGFGGTTSQSTGRDADSYSYEAEYSIGAGGLTVEYTLPFIKNFGVSLGAVIGGGGIQVDIYKNRGGVDWTLLENQTDERYHYTLNNNYWLFSPTLNIDIPFYRFLNLRIGGGYQLTIAEEWQIDNEQPLENVPSDLNGKAFYLQIGIFAGFFSF